MLTLEQLYKLGISQNIDIFGGITLPENSPINRKVLIDTIMEKCGLNFPMYADPFVMSSAITLWSARNQYTFIHVAKILMADYSPIENTDRIEDITVNRSRDMSDNTDTTGSKTEGLETGSTETNSGKDTTENTTSAENASDYQPDDKTELTHGHVVSTTGASTKTGSSTVNTDKTIDEDETTITSTHMHGNIGTVTNNQMQLEEYAMLKDYNPYTFLAGIFEEHLTLFVY